MMHYQMGLHDALSRYRWFSVLFEKQGKSQAKKEKKDNIGVGVKENIWFKIRQDTTRTRRKSAIV